MHTTYSRGKGFAATPADRRALACCLLLTLLHDARERAGGPMPKRRAGCDGGQGTTGSGRTYLRVLRTNSKPNSIVTLPCGREPRWEGGTGKPFPIHPIPTPDDGIPQACPAQRGKEGGCGAREAERAGRNLSGRRNARLGRRQLTGDSKLGEEFGLRRLAAPSALAGARTRAGVVGDDGDGPLGSTRFPSAQEKFQSFS